MPSIDPDLLLTLGFGLTSFVSGLAMTPLPSTLATDLGLLHVAHENAKTQKERFEDAKKDVNAKLEAHVARLRDYFTWS